MGETNRPVLGWREWVSLPDLGVDWIKAKIDTGARTSTLHVEDVEEFERDGTTFIRFTILPWQRSDLDRVVAEARLIETRDVRSSTGETQTRPVIRTTVEIGPAARELDITLTDRAGMGFRMLLGRRAVKAAYVVDPGRSYRAGRPPRPIRRRNRGRAE